MLLRQRFTRSGRAKGSGFLCMRRILDLFSLRTDLRVDFAGGRAEIAPRWVGKQEKIHERALVERSSQASRYRFHAKHARAHAARALRLAAAEELCRAARALG